MLERYGWSDTLRQHFQIHAAEGLIPARVVVQQRGLYEVVTAIGALSATLSGKFVFDARDGDYPVAGDWVAIAARLQEGTATIRHLLPRSSSFVRREAGPGAPRGQVVAANVDVALLLASLNADLSVRRIERYLATAWEGGASPVIVLTKADLCRDVEVRRAEVDAVAFGMPVHVISAVTGEGLDAVRACLPPGKTAVLVGSSGVGKSTLLNALAGKDVMATREIRGDDTGRHTTTHRELVLLASGALILDTPGMRELGLWNAGEGVATAFAEIEALAAQCRFHDCRHVREPNCAVLAALADGMLDPARWQAYGKLQRENRFEGSKDDWAARQEMRREHIRRSKAGRARMKFKRGEE